MPSVSEMTAGLADQIGALLKATHQGQYAPHVIAEAADYILSAPYWRDVLCSPVSLAELSELGVSGCLLSYAAALEEAKNPALTVERLEREADHDQANSDYHAKLAEEYSQRAKTWDTAFRASFGDTAAAHRECARLDREAAASKRATAREIARSIVKAGLSASVETLKGAA